MPDYSLLDILLVAGALLALFLCLTYLVFGFFAHFLTGVAYIRSNTAALPDVLRVVGVGASDMVWDLGSGDGKVLFKIEKATGAAGYGFELSIWPYCMAQIKRRFTGSKIKFLRKDFFTHDFTQPTLIYAYLSPELMQKLEPILIKKARAGLRLISLDFPLPTTKPVKTLSHGRHTYYLYQF